MTKIEALAEFLEVDANEAESQLLDYLILSEKEAIDKARNLILDSVWTFSVDILKPHLLPGLNVEQLRTFRDTEGEAVNDLLRAFIKSTDRFVDDVLTTFGRAYFLSDDGEEHQVGPYLIYRAS